MADLEPARIAESERPQPRCEECWPGDDRPCYRCSECIAYALAAERRSDDGTH